MPLPLKINWKMNISFGGVSRNDILFFTRHLSIALKNGLNLQEGLDMLKEQVQNQKFQNLIRDLLERIASGQPFYEALARYPKYFSVIYVNLVKTGELSGTLGENLAHLAEELRKAHEMQGKVRAAMMYPTLIFVAVVALGFSVAWFILPKILPLFKSLELDLPLSTRVLIRLAELFEQHGLLLFGGFVTFVVFFWWLLRRDFVKPFTHRLILKVPVAGKLIKNIQLERFSRMLSTLLKSGITLDRGLGIVADATTHRLYHQAMEACRTEAQKGQPLGNAMRYFPGLFPPMARRMVSMGEQTGSLETALEYLSQMYQDEIDNTLKNLSTILEPLLLVFIGLVVGGIAISILGPIYQITGGVRQ